MADVFLFAIELIAAVLFIWIVSEIMRSFSQADVTNRGGTKYGSINAVSQKQLNAIIKSANKDAAKKDADKAIAIYGSIESAHKVILARFLKLKRDLEVQKGPKDVSEFNRYKYMLQELSYQKFIYNSISVTLAEMAIKKYGGLNDAFKETRKIYMEMVRAREHLSELKIVSNEGKVDVAGWSKDRIAKYDASFDIIIKTLKGLEEIEERNKNVL